MPTVYRVTALWSGFQGAPGYTRLSFSDLTTQSNRDAAGAAVRSYFFALVTYIPTGVTINVQPTIQEYDVATGILTGENSMTTSPTTVTGTGSGTWAAGAGFFVGWNTGTIFNGRRVRGRTFHVPAVGAFDTDGTLNGTALGTIQTAAAALVAATNAELSVWAKQWNTTTSPPTQIGGQLAPVLSATVKDNASSLRTRRT